MKVSIYHRRRFHFLKDCINNLGAGFQVTTDLDAGLTVTGGNSLGGILGLKFCTAAGAIFGAGVKNASGS